MTVAAPWRIKQQGIIRTADDFLDLNIINWAGLNGSWRHSGAAMHSVCGWLINTTAYSVVEAALHGYPERADWPNWKHPGQHEGLARLYWNAFYARNLGNLVLADAPDFYGEFDNGDEGPVRLFWGDFGKVSAQAFALTLSSLRANDLWISVLDERTQVVLEPLVSLNALAPW